MSRTILQYIENPMGKGSAALPSRQLLMQDYARRFALLEAKYPFTPVIYKDKSSSVYYLYFKIPSETDKENTYDVVLEFTPQTKGMEKDPTIGDYAMRLFSNSPSFVYTFAYAYNKEDLLIESLAKEKYAKEVLSQPPVLRNPQQTLTYEKSTIFAILALTKDRKYLNKLIIDPIAQNYTPKKLSDAVRNDEKIKVQIKREQNRVKKEAEEKEKKQKKMFGESKTRKKKVPPPGGKKITARKSNVSSSTRTSKRKATKSNIKQK